MAETRALAQAGPCGAGQAPVLSLYQPNLVACDRHRVAHVFSRLVDLAHDHLVRDLYRPISAVNGHGGIDRAPPN